jgi:hypothetical protein
MIFRCSDLGIFDDSQVLNMRKQVSFRKWRTNEPLDDPAIIPLEEPRLLSKAFELVAQNGRIGIDEIKNRVQVNSHIIEDMCNLNAGTLDGSDPPINEPRLK